MPGLSDTVVGWGRYVEGVLCPDTRFDDAWAAARDGDGFFWVGVHAPNVRQLTQLGELFDVHPLAIEDAVGLRQRPKLSRHGTQLLMSLRTLAYVDRDARAEGGDVVQTGSIVAVVGERFVLTVRHGRHASMGELRQRLQSDPEHLALGPSAVLHAVLDMVVDDYLVVVDAVGEDIEDIESGVFGERSASDVERIYQLKRDIIEMKHTISALAGPVRELASRPQRLIHPDLQDYLADVSDHLDRVREHVLSFDELLTSILQAGLARLSISENEDLRRISAWVAIAAVPTMIAGIYGMNFSTMPELSQPWGYPAVLTVMGVSCGLLHRGFRRNGWL